MNPKSKKKMTLPPVMKLLIRGYLIMAFIIIVEYFGIITNIGLIIFLITTISVSMVFGVGYLLIMTSRPVRSVGLDIPNTALFFVKGIIVLYFISLLAEFGILPARITSLLMPAAAGLMIIIGVAGYVYEVMERSRPLPRSKPRTR